MNPPNSGCPGPGQAVMAAARRLFRGWSAPLRAVDGASRSLLFLLLTLSPLHATSLEEALDAGNLRAAEAELEALAVEWQEACETSQNPADFNEWARTLHALGIIERKLQQPADAADHLRAALNLLANAAPGEQADVREALALTLQDLGELEEAESLLREVLAQRDSEPTLSLSRDHLGLLLLTRGHYEDSGRLLAASLAATPADDHPALARRHGHNARYWHTLGSHSRARDHLTTALDLCDDRELKLALTSQLALASLRLGDWDAAHQSFDFAADEARQIYREAPLAATPHLNNLGAFAMARGEPEEARALFGESIELISSNLAPDHPALITPLNNLGTAQQLLGNYPAARTFLERAAELQQRHLPPGHLRVAETARNLATNALLSQDPDAPARIQHATRLGLELLERLVNHGTETERLNFLQRIDLVSLPCATRNAPVIANLLAASKARLLDSLLGTPSSSPPTWQQVRDTLPAHSAFIDFCRYTEPGPDPIVRYGAVIIVPDQSPAWIPLGSENTLQTWLTAFRQRLAWKSSALAGQPTTPPPFKLQGILQQLHEEFWQPLEAALPQDTRNLAISPDGALNFLPFPALIDDRGTLLCQRYLQLVTLTSARDLLDETPAAPLNGAPWLTAGVTDFPKRDSLSSTEPLSQVLDSLGPMPGTRKEIGFLKKIAPPATTILIGDEATESALRTSAGPHRVLHIGSHAFFLAHDAPDPGTGIDFDLRADLLFASGIVLHRAALREPDSPLPAPDDDLLFPSEIARLPLQSTRLVTLSSCESGAGTALVGEGVLGLRRAFALAGAREIMVALWPVSDRSTPEFMDRFYRLALHSDHPAQALWQTQREFLSNPTSDAEFEAAVLRHAPFVLSQRGPLRIATGIELPPSESFPWIYLLAVLPLLIYLAALLQRKDGARSTRE